jgi:hypothetical protein
MSVQNFKKVSGQGVNANDVLFVISETHLYNTFVLQATTGVVRVEASLDGQNWTQGLALDDLSGTDNTPVLTTAANDKAYGLRGTFRLLRVVQVGAAATDVVVNYGRM